MKQRLFMLLAAIPLMLANFTAAPYTFSIEEEDGSFSLCYRIDEDNNAFVSLSPDADTDRVVRVAIPQSVSDPSTGITYTVTGIENSGFERCMNLQEIELPKTLTTIGYSAFSECGLTNITLPDSVESIGAGAFNYCLHLTTINIPPLVKAIPSDLFFWCDMLKYITLGESIESIGANAFYNCSNLMAITLPSSVKEIGAQAFFDCTGLTEIGFGDSLESIGNMAFSGCTNLTSINTSSIISIGDKAFYGCTALGTLILGESLEVIGEDVFGECHNLTNLTIGAVVSTLTYSTFRDCTSLTTLHITDNATIIPEAVFAEFSDLTSLILGKSIELIGNGAFAGCSSINHLRIPDSTQCLAPNAFSGCNSLTELLLGESLISIGNGAFAGCSHLKQLSLPTSVRHIGNRAFIGCSSIPELLISDSVESIGESAFAHCTGLEELTIGKALDSIDSSTFSGCDGLTTLVIGDSATSVPDGAFANLRRLSSIVLGKGVESIGESAFSGCNALTALTLGDSIESIGKSAFAHCTGLEELTIGKALDSIDSSTFSGCDGLTTLVIGDSATSVPDGAFANLSRLSSIAFGNSIESIGVGSFNSCSSLTELTLPNSLEMIENFAFESCSGFTSLNIPVGLKYIGNSTFAGCNGVTEINYNAANCNIEEGNSIFWNPVHLTLGPAVKTLPAMLYSDHITFHQGLERIENPDIRPEYTVLLTDIDDWATNTPVNFHPKEKRGSLKFEYKGEPLTKVELGAKAERVGDYAFAYSDINSVSFSSYVGEIGAHAFIDTAIPTANLPEGLTTIGESAFRNCENLSEVTLPSTLQELGAYAFYGDSSLYKIEIPGNVSNIQEGCFQNCVDLETLTFNEGLKSVGKWAFIGCDRLSLPTMPMTLEEIETCAFMTKGTFTGDLIFGDNLTSIGSYAFANENVVTGSDYAVEGLLTVKLPQSLESIGEAAFYGQPIREVTLPENLTEFGSQAFSYTSVAELSFPASIVSLPEKACSNMSRLSKVTIPEGITEIGASAFAYSPLSHIALPSTLTKIGNKAFSNTAIGNCTVPNSVTVIGSEVFSSVNYLQLGTGIESINDKIAENVVVLEMMSATPPTLSTSRLGFTPDLVIVPEGAGAAYTGNNRWKDYNISARNAKKATVYVNEPGTLATEIRIQTGIMPPLVTNLVVEGQLNEDDFAVIRSNMTSCYDLDMTGLSNTSIPTQAFKGKKTLLNLTLPSDVKEIGDRAFADCSVLHLAELPASLMSIGEAAFLNCESLDSDFKLSTNFQELGAAAFWGCKSLRSVDFSGCKDMKFSDSSDGALADYGMFGSCSSLDWVALPEGMAAIQPNMFANSGISKLELPESIENIETGAFSDTYFLSEINFPKKLVRIAENTFRNSGLSGAVLPSSLRVLGNSAFEGSALSFASFDNGLTEIGENTFANCPFLMFVNLPNTLTSLGSNALASTSLIAITSPSLLPAATGNAPFAGVDNYSCALSIPKQSYSKYLQAEYWGSFVGIRNCIDVTIPEALSVTYMDEADYQDMLEEMEQPTEPSDVRRRALRMYAKARANENIMGYGKLFNGASLFLADNTMIRVFLDVPDGSEDLVVKYNGKDITDQIDPYTMSFVTPALTSISTLVIDSKILTAVETVDAEQLSERTPVYSLTGAIMGYGPAALNHLPKGIYIIGGKKVAVK